MGKHFVTVCVFCLLCATHTPCSSHIQYSTNEKPLENGQSRKIGDILPVKKSVFGKITDGYSPTIHNNDDKSSYLSFINSDDNILSNNLSFNKRTKREPHRVKNKFDEALYIEKIFRLFGNGETINQEGFERLIKSLHLDRLLWSKINLTTIHNISDTLLSTPQNKLAANSVNNDTNITCMNHVDLLRSVAKDSPASNSTKTSDLEINSSSFRRLCPVLLYQLAAPSSTERQGCIKVNQNGDSSDLQHFDDMHTKSSHWHSNNNIGSVWLYSTLSIIIISACGLLGVLVIPIMQQHYYQHLIQFLVALAVGTLSGDALLHLLPHAMMGGHHDHGSNENTHNNIETEDLHTRNMWRGFVAMVGLIFFFFMEKCLTLGAEWRKKRQLRKNKVPARVRVMRETDTSSNASVGCKHKYSSYPYCYGVIATETQDDHHNHPQHISLHNNLNEPSHNNTSTMLNDVDSDSEFLTKNPNAHTHQETNQNMSKCTTNHSKNMKCSESNKMLAENADTHTLQDFAAPKNEISESESYTVILRTHETKHHGHSHTHGHVHSAPKSMSSVAWMVIMGDGLHNFTDGMAIGAAFAGSLAGGFSTAVAVFCHELPHEIGDFAVLLKAGMTARQAVFYNMLSSVLCLMGMILGVFLGNNDSASSWIFASAAGMFLYIALVDMIPELTTNHPKEGGSLLQCVLQFFGLISGLGIMLLIALYENDLKQLFHD